MEIRELDKLVIGSAESGMCRTHWCVDSRMECSRIVEVFPADDTRSSKRKVGNGLAVRSSVRREIGICVVLMPMSVLLHQMRAPMA